jgi:hypothetical protein
VAPAILAARHWELLRLLISIACRDDDDNFIMKMVRIIFIIFEK